MNLWLYICNILILIFENYLYYDFQSGICKHKIINSKEKVLIFSTWILLVFLNCKPENLIINLLIIPLLYGLVGSIVFSCSHVKRFFYTFLFFSLLECIEIFMFSLFNLVSDNIEGNYSWHETIIYSIIVKFISLILIKLLKMYLFKQKIIINKKFLLYFVPLPISTILIYAVIFYNHINMKTYIEAKEVLLLGCIGILFSNIFLCIIFSNLKESIEKTNLLELEKMKDSLNHSYYEKIARQNKKHAQIIHDFSFYFETIGWLARKNDQDKIIQLLEEIDLTFQETYTDNYCTNRILNAILTEKFHEAKQNGIHFTLEISPDFSIEFMKDIDIISIFGNLLTNAIDAAKRSEDKMMHLVLLNSNVNIVFFKLENSFLEAPKRKGSLYETTKRDKENHGIGFKHTSRLIENYGGKLEVGIENHKFMVTTLLSSVT